MNLSLEHIAIPAADPKALKNWYEAVLEARLLFDNGQSPPTYLISLGNVSLEIYAAETGQPGRGNNRAAGFRHLALRVDSIADAKAVLEKRGLNSRNPFDRRPGRVTSCSLLTAKATCSIWSSARLVSNGKVLRSNYVSGKAAARRRQMNPNNASA